jgi:hypothetical protein
VHGKAHGTGGRSGRKFAVDGSGRRINLPAP